MKRAIWLSIVAMAMWSVQSLGAASEDINALNTTDHVWPNSGSFELTDWPS